MRVYEVAAQIGEGGWGKCALAANPDRLAPRGALPIDEALPIAKQIVVPEPRQAPVRPRSSSSSIGTRN